MPSTAERAKHQEPRRGENPAAGIAATVRDITKDPEALVAEIRARKARRAERLAVPVEQRVTRAKVEAPPMVGGAGLAPLTPSPPPPAPQIETIGSSRVPPPPPTSPTGGGGQGKLGKPGKFSARKGGR